MSEIIEISDDPINVVEVPQEPSEPKEIPESIESMMRKCEVCAYQTNKKSCLVFHQAFRHSMCPNCPAFFQSLKMLLEHQRNMHADEKTYKLAKCSVCDYISRKVEVEQHESKVHKIYRKDIYGNDMANSEVSEVSILNYPVTNPNNPLQNSNLPAKKSNYPIQNSNNPADLQNPEMAPESGFKCEFCSYVCQKQHFLLTHKTMVHRICVHCTQSFSTLPYLYKHQQKLHKETDNYSLKKCRFCEFYAYPVRYIDNHELAQHEEQMIAATRRENQVVQIPQNQERHAQYTVIRELGTLYTAR